jgi:proteasome lid subunit RPN8/RPN11
MTNLFNMVEYYTSYKEAMKSKQPIRYAIAGNGLVVIESNVFGTFWTPVAKDTKISGLNPVKPGFQLIAPKLSLELYYKIISFLKQAHRKYNSEALVFIYYDPQNKTYEIVVPEQEVTGASVDYKKDSQFELDGKVVFMEIHSHPGVLCTPSATDDKDELDTRFFAVVSGMDQTVPAMNISLVCHGTRIFIDNIEDIFAFDSTDYSTIINKKISRKTFSNVFGRYSQGMPSWIDNYHDNLGNDWDFYPDEFEGCTRIHSLPLNETFGELNNFFNDVVKTTTKKQKHSRKKKEENKKTVKK